VWQLPCGPHMDICGVWQLPCGPHMDICECVAAVVWSTYGYLWVCGSCRVVHIWISVGVWQLPCGPHMDICGVWQLPCGPHMDICGVWELPCGPHMDICGVWLLPCGPHVGPELGNCEMPYKQFTFSEYEVGAVLCARCESC